MARSSPRNQQQLQQQYNQLQYHPNQNYTNGHSATLPRDNSTQHHQQQLKSPSSEDSQLDDSDRGRDRRKKRDFFGTIKRRLGRSKTRTKSADRGMIPINAENPNGETRSVSADRSLHNNNTSTGLWYLISTLRVFFKKQKIILMFLEDLD